MASPLKPFALRLSAANSLKKILGTSQREKIMGQAPIVFLR